MKQIVSNFRTQIKLKAKTWIVLLVILLFVIYLVSTSLVENDGYLRLNQPPRLLIVKAESMFAEDKLAHTAMKDSETHADLKGMREAVLHAVDLGSGIGNETLFLLKKGYAVTAIDNESRAFKSLYNRVSGEPYFGHLKTIQSDFTKLDWSAISKSDLFLASFALHFCPKNHFESLWKKISASINPGGYFVGQFYDPDYQGFTKKQRQFMTFLTEQEVLQLFKNFNIKYLTRKSEISFDSKYAKTRGVYFEVIAQKKRGIE